LFGDAARMRQARQAGRVRTVGEHGARRGRFLRRCGVLCGGVTLAELGPGGVGVHASTVQRRQVVLREAVPRGIAASVEIPVGVGSVGARAVAVGGGVLPDPLRVDVLRAQRLVPRLRRYRVGVPVRLGVGVGRGRAHRVRGRGQLRPRVATVVLDVMQTRAQGGPRRVGEHRLGRGRDRRGHHVAQPGVVLTTAGGRGHRVRVLLNVAAAEPGGVGHHATGPRSCCLLLLLLCGVGGPQLSLSASVGHRQAGGQHRPRDGGNLAVHLVSLIVGCAHGAGPFWWWCRLPDGVFSVPGPVPGSGAVPGRCPTRRADRDGRAGRA